MVSGRSLKLNICVHILFYCISYNIHIVTLIKFGNKKLIKTYIFRCFFSRYSIDNNESFLYDELFLIPSTKTKSQNPKQI